MAARRTPQAMDVSHFHQASPLLRCRLPADVAAMWRYVHARTVARVNYRLSRRVPDHGAELQAFLRRAADAQPGFSILQVGAFDGVSNDPIHDLLRRCGHVRAVLLEPQPGPYASLRDLWRDDPRVVPLQAALAGECGERPVFVVAEHRAHLHPFAAQLASFSRRHVESECRKYVWRPPPDMVTSVRVKTLDWRTLVERHGPFDLVAIDAEGYDGEILHQIDLSEQPPGLIIYEHCHLTRRMRERCAERLGRAGYRLTLVSRADTFATRLAAPGF